jgi:hypothetical protein
MQCLSAYEKAVLRCAIADLIGAYEAVVMYENPSVHDWDAHKDSIVELCETFPFLADEYANWYEDSDD